MAWMVAMAVCWSEGVGRVVMCVRMSVVGGMERAVLGGDVRG